MAKKQKGSRATFADLFDGRGLKIGDHVLLGGTSASYPAYWYLGKLLWVGKEDILIERSTQNGQTYVQHDSIYAVRAVGEISELVKIQDVARRAVKELTDLVHEAEAALGDARAALHARLDELQKGGLKIEAFDQVAIDARDAEVHKILEKLDGNEEAA